MEYLSSNDKNIITIFDLRSMYAQSLSELKITDNVSVIQEKSIFNNIRNLNKINKFIFLITNFLL